MARAWRDYRDLGAPGVIWMDCDIAADPYDLDSMRSDIQHDETRVYVAPHKLWPGSTHRDSWVWGHGPMRDDNPRMAQAYCAKPEWFALGFTYTPARLLNIVLPDLPAWRFGQIDMSLSRLARENSIEISIVYGVHVKHLHLTDDPDYLAWAGEH